MSRKTRPWVSGDAAAIAVRTSSTSSTATLHSPTTAPSVELASSQKSISVPRASIVLPPSLTDLVHLEGETYFRLWTYRGKLRRRYFIRTVCGSCGNEVFAHRSNFTRSKQSFCSGECKKAGAPRLGRKFKRGSGEGYVLLYRPDHPYARKGYVAEHRLVVEASIGRVLLPTELVHHIDCNKQNNELENLIVCSFDEHNHAHASLEKCVMRLLKGGTLFFDREKKIYYVEDYLR